ncbi:MAG: hypothetical protein ABSH04_07230 [Acidimicrobiales bacterium]
MRDPRPVNASVPDAATAVGVEPNPWLAEAGSLRVGRDSWLVETGSLVPLEPSACVVGVCDCGAVLATSGQMGDPTGGALVIPVGALSFGYETQVIVNERPATSNVDVVAGVSRMLTMPPVAVNGPRSVGDDGVTCVTPEDGMGCGRGTSRLIAPVESEDGVAPEASKVDTVVPVIAFAPKDAASDATSAGIVTWRW